MHLIAIVRFGSRPGVPTHAIGRQHPFSLDDIVGNEVVEGD